MTVLFRAQKISGTAQLQITHRNLDTTSQLRKFTDRLHTFFRNEYQKIDVYKRISGIENQEEYLDMQDELIDRFGELPRSVENLLKIADLKALAHQAGVVEVDVKKQDITIQMYQKANLDVSGISKYSSWFSIPEIRL